MKHFVGPQLHFIDTILTMIIHYLDLVQDFRGKVT